jgi:DNA polymerase/3'-5' exonuclease PolX
MSATETRVPLADARAVADELALILGLGCERMEIAGSIRRARADVGDIELVAVPRRRTETVPDGLFETREVEYNELTLLVDTLIVQGERGMEPALAPHPTDRKRGERYAKLLHPASGLQVDLFSATAATFGLILLIRTGPAGYSQWLVTEARRRGFHVEGGELHRGQPDSLRPHAIIPTPEEADVYDVLGMSFVEPVLRQ